MHIPVGISYHELMHTHTASTPIDCKRDRQDSVVNVFNEIWNSKTKRMYIIHILLKGKV